MRNQLPKGFCQLETISTKILFLKIGPWKINGRRLNIRTNWPSPPTHGHLGQVQGLFSRFCPIITLRDTILLNIHSAPEYHYNLCKALVGKFFLNANTHRNAQSFHFFRSIITDTYVVCRLSSSHVKVSNCSLLPPTWNDPSPHIDFSVKTLFMRKVLLFLVPSKPFHTPTRIFSTDHQSLSHKTIKLAMMLEW